MSMRGVYTNVVEIRQKVFTEVARMAFEGGDYSRIIDLPYKIIPGEVATYRESVFWRERLWRSVCGWPSGCLSAA